MNNESEPQATLLDNGVASSTHSDHTLDANQESSNAEARRSRARSRERQRKARLVQIKIQFLSHLLRSLDILLYYYFSYAYFLDASFFRFILRCAIQLNFLTPKPANFPHSFQRRSVIYGIFGIAFFCILCHVLNPEPSAGESTGGYLHGGLLIDFVGQEGPVCKLRLVTTDLIILILQVFMVATALEKHLLKYPPTRSTPAPAQDLESEERGELAREATAENMSGSEISEGNSDISDGESDGGGDIGPETLLPHVQRGRQLRQRRQRGGGEASDGREQDENSSSLEDNDADDDDGRYNAYSGQLVVVNVRLVDAIKLQWSHGNRLESMPASAATESSPLRRHSSAREEALSILARLNAQRQTGGF